MHRWWRSQNLKILENHDCTEIENKSIFQARPSNLFVEPTIDTRSTTFLCGKYTKEICHVMSYPRNFSAFRSIQNALKLQFLDLAII